MHEQRRDLPTKRRTPYTYKQLEPAQFGRNIRTPIPNEAQFRSPARRKPYNYQPTTPPTTPQPKTKHIKKNQKRSTRRWTHYVMFSILALFCVIASYSAYVSYSGKKSGITPLPTTTSNKQSTQAQNELTATMQKNIDVRLQTFEDAITSIKKSGKDASKYEQQFNEARNKASSITKQQDYLNFFIQSGVDLAALQSDLAGNASQPMLDNYLTAVQNWGNAHKYKNPYDQKEYYLNSSYMNMDGNNGFRYGEASYLQNAVATGDPTAQRQITEAYFLHAMLEANFEDKTPYNQPHAVDSKLMNYFGVQNAHVLVVSLTEQSMRIYRNGKFEEAIQVTTGRHHRPTPPGSFTMSAHHYNVPFTSFDQPGTPDYYESVIVERAIDFWTNGYLIHSSHWRKDYGPRTNLPHKDSSGDSEANNGSHGCINVEPNTLKRLDPTITPTTKLIIF